MRGKSERHAVYPVDITPCSVYTAVTWGPDSCYSVCSGGLYRQTAFDSSGFFNCSLFQTLTAYKLLTASLTTSQCLQLLSSHFWLVQVEQMFPGFVMTSYMNLWFCMSLQSVTSFYFPSSLLRTKHLNFFMLIGKLYSECVGLLWEGAESLSSGFKLCIYSNAIKEFLFMLTTVVVFAFFTFHLNGSHCINFKGLSSRVSSVSEKKPQVI